MAAMGEAGAFTPERLVIGVLISRPERRQELLDRLADRGGPIDFATDSIPFTYTDYYREEMGDALGRFYTSFQRLVDPGDLASIKLATNELELGFREPRGRTVNLDPGILSLSRFALATTKDSGHRIPLSRGIYAEVTLRYQGGGFRPLPWTYPDYSCPTTIAILTAIRQRYRAELRARGTQGA
jgi:hypothetical protein